MEREESLGLELEIRERESLRSSALGFRFKDRGKNAQVQPWRPNLGLAIKREKEMELPQMVAHGGSLWWHQVGMGHFEREKLPEGYETSRNFEKETLICFCELGRDVGAC